jgi:TPR repeat protein
MAEAQGAKWLNEQGDAYFEGVGKPQNKELAYTYYKQAADLDNPLGHLNIGKYFLDKKDYKKALEAIQKARSYRYPAASLLLSKMARTGQGLKKNKTKAFKFALEAAEWSDVDGYLEVASCYEDGFGVKRDVEKAFAYYKKAAELDHPKGLYKVGRILLETPKEKTGGEEALRFLDKAAMTGEPMAIRTLIDTYQKASTPYLKKKSRGYCDEMTFYYRELLARTGDDVSLREVAEAYHYGNPPVKKNPEKAFLYFSKLAEMKDAVGYHGLGMCHQTGQGVKIDLTKAKAYYEAAASLSHAGALTKLGDLIRAQATTPEDFERARDRYLEAAKQNDLEAVINLGLLHYRGQIPNAQSTLAFQYFDTAAKKGAVGAWYWLGVLYQKGEGVEANRETAKKMFKRAMADGHLGAKFKLATSLLEEAEAPKMKPKTQIQLRVEAKRLLLEYVLDEKRHPANAVVAMRLLGEAFERGDGEAPNPRAARYWHEAAALEGDGTAMLWMMRALKTKEPQASWNWLEKACADVTFAEAHYQKGLILLEGVSQVVKVDLIQARQAFETAARMNHPQAVAKLMVL